MVYSKNVPSIFTIDEQNYPRYIRSISIKMRVTNEKTLPTAIEDEPLSLKLADRNTSIIVDGQLKISFRRTIRVPDNEQSSALPPDLGAFKLTNVNYGSGRLPAAVKAKGGLLLPMYRMFENLLAPSPFWFFIQDSQSRHR